MSVQIFFFLQWSFTMHNLYVYNRLEATIENFSDKWMLRIAKFHIIVGILSKIK